MAPLAHEEAAEAQTLGLVEQVEQRLALDARDAHVCRPGDLQLAWHGLEHAVEP